MCFIRSDHHRNRRCSAPSRYPFVPLMSLVYIVTDAAARALSIEVSHVVVDGMVGIVALFVLLKRIKIEMFLWAQRRKVNHTTLVRRVNAVGGRW